MKVKFEPLLKRLKRTLSVYISNAKISRQLATSPCAVIASGQALDSATEKLLKAQQQAKSNPSFDHYLRQKFTLEINPNHEIIIKLLEKAEDTSDVIEDTIHVLFESTMIASGYSIRNPKKFGTKIQTVIKKSLGIEAVLDEEYNAGYADGSEEQNEELNKGEDFKEDMNNMFDNVARAHNIGSEPEPEPKKDSDENASGDHHEDAHEEL
jgi:hypothetical protein